MNSSQLSPLELPRSYNAATHFIDRHLDEGRASKTAVIDEQGSYTYAQLAERVNRAAGALLQLGLEPEQRVLLCLLDTVDFPTVFWGAIKAGLVPVPVNTLLTQQDYAYLLDDSRARALVVSSALYDGFARHLDQHGLLEQVIVSGSESHDHQSLDALLAASSPMTQPASTTCDDTAFWLYTSGSTGTPKGAVHRHSDLVQTAHLYGQGVLGIREEDVVFSAAKLFFAYGLGNAMSFPFHVGATAVLLAQRPTPHAVLDRLKQCAATIFYGVPTLYGAMLADAGNDRSQASDQLRLCVSAGEALPEEVGRDIAMHIAASRPLCIDESAMPAEVLQKERDIYSAQAAESGKPAEIVEKMVSGRISKFLKENTLVGQPFVKNPDQTVGELLATRCVWHYPKALFSACSIF